MARKRIKTLATELHASVEEVLASCERLKLSHAHSESSLVGTDEVDKIKADLESQARRAEVMHRETVLDTAAGGKVVEKRLSAGVMRRRHTEPDPAAASASTEPFQFDAGTAPADEPFTSFLDQPGEPEPAAPLSLEPVGERETSREGEAAASAPPMQAAANGGVATSGGALAQGREPRPRPAPETIAPESASAAVRAGSPARPKTVSLTSAAHAAAPTLDDGQKGPKVLGKIDLREAAQRPAAARTGVTGRPAIAGRGAGATAPSAGETPPPDQARAGTRPLRKKKVVKKDAFDPAAEREMRGLRVPKKRRALPGKEQHKTEITTPKESKRVVRIAESVTVGDLSRQMGVKAAEVIKKLMELGMMSTLNQMLDLDTATLVATDFGYRVESVAFDVESAIEEEVGEAVGGEALPRPPVVTVMGHVDHGKTSLLDAIRHTSVAAGESGGITQHIGAYTVEAHSRTITFVDTPGHEAFTAMRARGAKVTDIVVLVVAADEGVMPQTVEALNHARAAKVPIVVAVNKTDRPEANVDRVKQQLTEQGLIPEDYGGDIITVPLSARTGDGVERLLEMLLLQADVLELKANPQRPARGIVVESQLDRGRGPVATVLVQEGTLRQGDPFVCGVSYGRVRAMADHRGDRITEAGPSIPIEIFGLSAVPEPGTTFSVMTDEGKARQVAEFRRGKQREGELAKSSRVSLEDLSQRMTAGEIKELKVIIKGDVQGSVEALADALRRLSTDEVKLDVIHTSAGAVSETDVSLAAASGAVIIAFNVRPEPKAVALAEKGGVEIRAYTIIYEAINEMREALEGLLAPTMREKAMGRIEVRKIFQVPGATVAGCMVGDGKITRSAQVRLVRDGRVVWEGKVASLKRFKDDAREVAAGYECGIALDGFNDVKPDDVIEAYEMEAVARKLAVTRPEPVRSQQSAEKQLST